MNIKLKATYPVNEDENKEIVIENNSIDILADDGRTLYSLELNEDGQLTVSTSSTVKVNEKILDSQVIVKPKASNVVKISREEYTP